MEIEQLIIIPKASAFKWGLAAPLPRVLKHPVVYTYLMKPVEIHLLEPKQNVIVGPAFGSSLCQRVWIRNMRPNACLAVRKQHSGGFLDVGGKRELGLHVGTDPISCVCCTVLHALTSPMDSTGAGVCISPGSAPQQWGLNLTVGC